MPGSCERNANRLCQYHGWIYQVPTSRPGSIRPIAPYRGCSGNYGNSLFLGLGLGLGLVSANGVGQKQVFQSLVWFPEPEIRKIEGAGMGGTSSRIWPVGTDSWRNRPHPFTKTPIRNLAADPAN